MAGCVGHLEGTAGPLCSHTSNRGFSVVRDFPEMVGLGDKGAGDKRKTRMDEGWAVRLCSKNEWGSCGKQEQKRGRERGWKGWTEYQGSRAWGWASRCQHPPTTDHPAGAWAVIFPLSNCASVFGSWAHSGACGWVEVEGVMCEAPLPPEARPLQAPGTGPSAEQMLRKGWFSNVRLFW